jgi:hypothetical protein
MIEFALRTADQRGEGPLVQDGANSVFDSYRHAFEIKDTYDLFMAQLASKSGGKYTPLMGEKALKNIFRALEKMFLQGQDPLTQATVLDIVRGLLEFDSMENMLKAVEYLFACDSRFDEGKQGGTYFAAASRMAKVTVLRVKDRMAKPTKGGWADAMINFTFADDTNKHACKIQLVRRRMLTDRNEGGAHHGYGIYRAAFEILESIDALPPSELESETAVDASSDARPLPPRPSKDGVHLLCYSNLTPSPPSSSFLLHV